MLESCETKSSSPNTDWQGCQEGTHASAWIAAEAVKSRNCMLPSSLDGHGRRRNACGHCLGCMALVHDTVASGKRPTACDAPALEGAGEEDGGTIRACS